ncbi:hypothetical protein H1C71_036487 [Ictidomys tridecemlineatus]|nr:hypothetical protein H1C71_036487 [Ictidomys tridecemlineatus]
MLSQTGQSSSSFLDEVGGNGKHPPPPPPPKNYITIWFRRPCLIWLLPTASSHSTHYSNLAQFPVSPADLPSTSAGLKTSKCWSLGREFPFSFGSMDPVHL